MTASWVFSCRIVTQRFCTKRGPNSVKTPEQLKTCRNLKCSKWRGIILANAHTLRIATSKTRIASNSGHAQHIIFSLTQHTMHNHIANPSSVAQNLDQVCKCFELTRLRVSTFARDVGWPLCPSHLYFTTVTPDPHSVHKVLVAGGDAWLSQCLAPRSLCNKLGMLTKNTRTHKKSTIHSLRNE